MPTVEEINNTKSARAEHYRQLLADQTVDQMDKRMDCPTGFISLSAWNIVRLEKLVEEHIARRKALLLEIFPSITDGQLEAIDLEDESNGRGGLIIRLKETPDVK